ncbi:SDR family NAD(P)-dependent oxidoreductase [Frigoribacterium sp. CFBP 13712]|uniref:SDR family NAD(P)-dependent oxidoreductase n=1 Tax=Frigoribacterium sp. CFBP 13712 TaxID=2775309 RepID=UPI00177BD323|nr:SDR family NAD(P)-dependent oxidoreductase [Frigoribacterium sp. CFBP 13712]MBD8702869.1 SDR family NAD(P)-dependent oxidoreductase [Frigoribacterium sp. CFBP 13712]
MTVDPADPDTPRFGESSTAHDVIEGIDLHGRNALVTGASSGIGVETVRALAEAGATVVLAVRDVEAGRSTADEIRARNPAADLRVLELDLADLDSVKRLSGAWSGPLHLLVANAGVMHVPERRTARGHEWHFGVNHLGHFALATGLHGPLASADGARIVSLSSSGHGASGIRFDDMHFRRTPYDSGLAYGQSKTANVLFGIEATRRWRDDGITAAAVMPGGIWTGLQRHWDPAVLAEMKVRYSDGVKTVEQGAATSVFVATRAELGVGAPAYWEDCGPADVVDDIVDGIHGVVRHALDPDAARRLWSESEALIG